MPELRTSPAFESALRAGLARLADSAPVPDGAHLDALEARPHAPGSHPQRDRRPLALIAAAIVVIAGILGGAAVIRSADGGTDRTHLDGGTSTTTTTGPPVGPVLPARQLAAPFPSLAPDDASGSAPTVGVMNAATSPAELAQLWAEAGLPASDLPTVDFAEELVVELAVEDTGCPSDDLEFRKRPGAVRGQIIEPASCPDPLPAGRSHVYFYALRWADTGRPFSLELADPTDPDAYGAVPVD